MAVRKTTSRQRKKKSSKKNWLFPSAGRLFLFILLFLFLIFSLCTAGYVIFFRTVFAQEIMPSLKNNIVFEEPDPPVALPKYKTQDLNKESKEEGHSKEKEALVADIEKLRREVSLPKVAVIVDDIGYNLALGEELLDMPLELTLSFLPYAPYTKILEQRAYSQGKTVFLHLPLQPNSAAFDPGPGALLVSDSPEVQLQKLRRCLAEVPHAVGVNNHMGSLFTEDKNAMIQIMTELGHRSLFFVDSYTSSNSVGLESAREQGIRSARRHVFLDNILTREHICGQLDKLVATALQGGVGIGIAHPHAATLDALRSCSPQYSAKVQYVSVVDVL
ncbi:divergent polysaccharide deacetylase family protein [Desulforhopalus sp. IMCC35007]|nr:divergent polysaccharide deacetylase family protein [Desulforhopalus sp. IMCC35007]